MGTDHNKTVQTTKKEEIAHSSSSSNDTQDAKEEIKVSGATTKQMLENKLIPLGLDSGGFNMVQRDQLSSDSDLSPDENAINKLEKEPCKELEEQTSLSSDQELDYSQYCRCCIPCPKGQKCENPRQITMQLFTDGKVYTKNINSISDIIQKTEDDIMDMRSIINDRIFELAKSGEGNFDVKDIDHNLPDINIEDLVLGKKKEEKPKQSIDEMRSNFEMLISKNIQRTQ